MRSVEKILPVLPIMISIMTTAADWTRVAINNVILYYLDLQEIALLRLWAFLTTA